MARRGLTGPLQRATLISAILGSSMVERPAVNRMVAGSSPARGARPSERAALFAFLGALGSPPPGGIRRRRPPCMGFLGWRHPRRVKSHQPAPQASSSAAPDRAGESLSLWALAALCSVPCVMVLGNSMLIPVLPAMGHALDVIPVQVGLLITAFSVPAGLLIPLAGALADRYGRKIIMVPALMLYGLGGLLAGTAALWLAKPVPYLLGARILDLKSVV